MSATKHVTISRKRRKKNKAIVDYTSPALCTPVTPFPPIGDAAYRQRAGGGPSHGHRQHAQKMAKTHRQTYSSQYFATTPAGEVKMIATAG